MDQILLVKSLQKYSTFVVFCKIVSIIINMKFFDFFKPTRRQLQQRIFLDYASITPVDTRVEKAMANANRLTFANPSALYGEALKAKELVSESRKKIADVLNAQKSEIYFTAGGTEGNNLAI